MHIGQRYPQDDKTIAERTRRLAVDREHREMDRDEGEGISPGKLGNQEVDGSGVKRTGLYPVISDQFGDSFCGRSGRVVSRNNGSAQQKIMQQQRIQSPCIKLKEVSEEETQKSQETAQEKQLKKDLKRKLELEQLRRESGITKEEFLKLESGESAEERQSRRKTRASSRQLQVKQVARRGPEVKKEIEEVKEERKSEKIEESDRQYDLDVEQANEDSEFLPHSPEHGYMPKKLKGVPSFKRYDEVKQMLLDMNGFPWDYPTFQRKGINLEQQFNQEMCWLSINAVYFPHNILEVNRQIHSPTTFVNKFKSEKLNVNSKRFYEEELIQKQIDLEVELEKNGNLVTDLGNSILSPQEREENELEKAIAVLQQKLEGEQKETASSFTTTIQKMQKCLKEGQVDQVLRLREQDIQAEAEAPDKSYSYHDVSMLEEIERLGKFQKENENNLLCDLYPKHPDAQKFFQILEQKHRTPKIGSGALFAEELKRNQHQKSSQRILINRTETSAREIREMECSQSFTKHLKNPELEVKSDKGFEWEENQPVEQQLKQEEVVCMICNDGDYDDDNLIVFCERCNLSTHESCYGIQEVPSGQWYCDQCQYLRESAVDGILKSKNICPLCPFSDGLMKPTLIPKNQERRPEPAQKSKKKRKGVREIVTARSPKVVDFYENYDLGRVKWMHLSCALFIPEIGFIDTNTKSPISGRKDLRLGIDNIDPKRYKLTCFICKTKDGACVQCAKGKCQVAFHVECARRSHYHMEVIRINKDVRSREYQQQYAIYCEKHRPLEVIKTLQSMEKNQQTKITQFCKTLFKAKCEYMKCEALPRTRKERLHLDPYNRDRLRKSPHRKRYDSSDLEYVNDRQEATKFRRPRNIGKLVNKEEEEQFLKLIREYAKNGAKCTITLKKIRPKQELSLNKRESTKLKKTQQQKEEMLFEDLTSGDRINPLEERKLGEIVKSEKASQSSQEQLTPSQELKLEQEPIHTDEVKYKVVNLQQKVDYLYFLGDDFPWDDLDFKNFTGKQCYEIFSHLIPNEVEYREKILRTKNMKDTKQKEEEKTRAYCVCRKIRQNYAGLWIECSGKECAYGNWMHGDCLGLENMFEKELELMGKYYCDSCKRKEKKGRNFPYISAEFEEQIRDRSKHAKNSKRKKNKRSKRRDSRRKEGLEEKTINLRETEEEQLNKDECLEPENAKQEQERSMPSIPNEQEKIISEPFGDGLVIKIKLEKLDEGSEEKKPELLEENK